MSFPSAYTARYLFRMFFRVAGILSVLASCSSVKAEGALEFDATVKTITSDLSTRYVNVTFQVTNISTVPVTILKVETGCTCTEYSVSADILEPKQRGTVSLKIDIAGRQGNKTVATAEIMTDERDQKYTLSAILPLPMGFSIERHFLTWKQGEERKEKMVRITAGNGSGLTLTDVKISSSNFKVRLTNPAANREWCLWVLPDNIEQLSSARVTLVSNSPFNDQELCVYAIVTQ